RYPEAPEGCARRPGRRDRTDAQESTGGTLSIRRRSRRRFAAGREKRCVTRRRGERTTRRRGDAATRRGKRNDKAKGRHGKRGAIRLRFASSAASPRSRVAGSGLVTVSLLRVPCGRDCLRPLG